MFNVIVLGAENTDNYDLFKRKMIHMLENKAKAGEFITIYTIGDEFVEIFSNRFGIAMKKFLTDWKTFGRDALLVRNESMIKDANAIVLFDCGIKDHQAIYNYASKNPKIAKRKIDCTT